MLVTHVGKEAFIFALNDGKLLLEVMKQEPQNVQAALSHTIKLKVFKQSLAYRVLWLTIMTAVPCSGHVLSVQLQVIRRQVRLPHSAS